MDTSTVLWRRWLLAGLVALGVAAGCKGNSRVEQPGDSSSSSGGNTCGLPPAGEECTHPCTGEPMIADCVNGSWTCPHVDPSSCCGPMPVGLECADPSTGAPQEPVCTDAEWYCCARNQIADAWSTDFGGSGDQKASAIATDAAGNILLAGYFQNTLNLGGGDLVSAGDVDGFLAKLTPGGGHLYSMRFGSTGAQSATDLAVDPLGNVILIGEFTDSVDFGNGPIEAQGPSDQFGPSDLFIAKFDPDGNVLWGKGVAGGPDGFRFMHVAVDATGNIVIAGNYSGSIDFGGGPLQSAGGLDIVVASLSPAGDHLWSKRFGDTEDEWSVDMALDPAGDILLTGGFEGTIDFGGGPLLSEGLLDVFVARWSSGGQHLWSRRFGDYHIDHGTSIAADSQGRVVVEGRFEASIDFGGEVLDSVTIDADHFIVGLDAAGAHRFSFAATGMMWSWDIAVDDQDAMLVYANFSKEVEFSTTRLCYVGGEDLFLVKINPDGSVVWGARFGDGHSQLKGGMALDPSGDVLLTGSFEGALDLGNSKLTTLGGHDIFLVRFGQGPSMWAENGER